MKIGDKVKFLSETGGGKIAGFQGKNIVLVEDEDGFQIPTPINEVVVVNTEDYSTANVINKRAEAQEQSRQETPLNRGHKSVKALMQEGQDEDVDTSTPDTVDMSKEVTYKPKAEERKGGNQLSAYLAFVPMKDNSIDTPHFEVYFVNDSNYYMRYVILTQDSNSYTLKSEAEAEPNMKIFIEELKGTQNINHVGKVTVQLIAYKRDKPFLVKEPVTVDFRLEPLKFYKVHTFEENPFFDVPCLLYTIIENDKPARPLVIDAKELKREMYANGDDLQGAALVTVREGDSNHNRQPSTLNSQRDQLVRRYENDQSKGNPKNSPYIRHRGLDDALVVDLHADALLDTTAGMSAGDILEYQMKIFRQTLAKYADKKGQKLVFIHGKGAGVLRRSIINELTYKHKSYQYQDASFQEYGYGATQVTIK